MRLSKLIVMTFAVLVICSTSAYGQDQIMAIYFNEGMYQIGENCLGVGVLDTLYVTAIRFGASIKEVHYKIVYPDQITWLMDFDVPAGTEGNTVIGISEVFDEPIPAFGKTAVAKVLVQWECDGCEAWMDQHLPVLAPHPSVGALRVVTWPELEVVTPHIWGSWICPIIPVDESTWGKIKALYKEGE